MRRKTGKLITPSPHDPKTDHTYRITQQTDINTPAARTKGHHGIPEQVHTPPGRARMTRLRDDSSARPVPPPADEIANERAPQNRHQYQEKTTSP